MTYFKMRVKSWETPSHIGGIGMKKLKNLTFGHIEVCLREKKKEKRKKK